MQVKNKMREMGSSTEREVGGLSYIQARTQEAGSPSFGWKYDSLVHRS